MRGIVDAFNQPTAEVAPFTVADVLRDAIFIIDSTRNTQSREDLPLKMEENLQLLEALNSETTPLTKDQKDAIKGYLLGMQGSDYVKAQVLRVLNSL